MFEDFVEKVSELKVVPVVVLESVEDAEDVADALVKGGLPAAEVTLRTPCALDCIAKMSENKDILVGAGTVLSVKQADDAIAAGAKFIVSPGFDEEVVSHCIELGVPVIPGTVTPSEVIAARKLGLTFTKFFPAGIYGGAKAIKALGSVFRDHKFMPTGGVNAQNLNEYLDLDCIVACGGTWLTKQDVIEAKDFNKIEQLAHEAKELANK